MKRTTRRVSARQRGAVLVVSLVMLVVLTLLGVSVMNITQLEERMASNTQEMVQAFQSAETGLSQGFNDNSAWSFVSSTDVQDINITNASRTNITSYRVKYLGSTTAPPRWNVSEYKSAHFDFRSTGSTSAGPDAFRVGLHGGGIDGCKIGAC